MEVLQLSDDSSDESGSDLEIYVPSNTRVGGAFDSSLWDYLRFRLNFQSLKRKKKVVNFELSNYQLCFKKFPGQCLKWGLNEKEKILGKCS